MMPDMFDLRNAKPMLLHEKEAFDSRDFIYELKLDGVRALAYLDKNETNLRNKRNKILNNIYPELNDLHKRINNKCILDGELVVLKEGKPDFFEIQRRSLMNNKFKIELSAKSKPVRFITYDILYYEDQDITQSPLLERKKLLEDVVREDEKIAVSRYIHDKGIEFFKLTETENLEGVVAKKKDSLYFCGTRSKDWFKFKNMFDSEFIICGYVLKENTLKSVALGAYYKGKLVNQGHVALGIPKDEVKIILEYGDKHFTTCPYEDQNCDEETIYIEPKLVCTVKYMMRTKSLSLRQPVYKGLRMDKTPEECIIKE